MDKINRINRINRINKKGANISANKKILYPENLVYPVNPV